MTGDIRQKLFSSEAAESLQMEHDIAKMFIKRHWPAGQSTYYIDPDTEKIRELDVYVHKPIMSRSRRLRLVFHNYLLCECKTLKSQHLLFVDDRDLGSRSAGDGLSQSHTLWLGHEDTWKDIFTQLRSHFGITDPEQTHRLREYFLARSHPDGYALIINNRIDLPPVDIVSTGMRETNSERTRDENSSVIWQTILALSSIRRAVSRRFLDGAFESVLMPLEIDADRSDQQINYISFFFDDELLKIGYILPVIFVKGSLWKLAKGGVKSVSSVRYVVEQINYDKSYVDIVSFGAL